MIYWFVIASIALFTLACCIAQYKPLRRHAAYVYGTGCGGHFLLFEALEIYDVNYHWSLYYVFAGAFGFFVAVGLENLKERTQFSFHLQIIALASIVINFLGGIGEHRGIDYGYYVAASFSLYLLLILELLRDGISRRSSRSSSLFNFLRWDNL